MKLVCSRSKIPARTFPRSQFRGNGLLLLSSKSGCYIKKKFNSFYDCVLQYCVPCEVGNALWQLCYWLQGISEMSMAPMVSLVHCKHIPSITWDVVALMVKLALPNSLKKCTSFLLPHFTFQLSLICEYSLPQGYSTIFQPPNTRHGAQCFTGIHCKWLFLSPLSA